MGDRCLIVVTDGDDISPAIYVHWMGHEVPMRLVEAGEAGIVRSGDVSYASARICGFLCAQNPTTPLSVGLFDAPADLEDATLEEASHGDAGVVVVNVKDGSLRYVAGYHARATGLPDRIRLVP